MKRLSVFGLVGVLASVLAGCPIFDDGPGNGSGTGCFGDQCVNPQPECTTSAQCGLNETCGSDQKCHVGDCTQWGCATGDCVINDDMTATCGGGGSSSGTAGSGGQGGSGGSGATGGGGSGTTGGGGSGGIYCGNPDDCSVGNTCAPSTKCEPGDCNAVGCIFGYTCDAPTGICQAQPGACGNDGDCALSGTGYACVSGQCTAPEDQCFDQGQCSSSDKCAGGKCTPSCTADADCPVSYTCDTALGLCTNPAKSCTITNDCGGPDAVCVNGACVPRSTNGTCPSGTSWVENGCVPDQKASFTCTVDGSQDACAGGSLCLHHSCYISCAPPFETACDNLPQINQCKSVTSSSGAHQVCGSSTSLGNECDPQGGVACAVGKICVDGYCK